MGWNLGSEYCLFSIPLVSSKPCTDHGGDVIRCRPLGQQMVGAWDRNETLRVIRSFEYAMGMVNRDGLVRRRVQNQEGTVEFANGAP